MYTIYDYLKYYKDYDIKEKPWSIMDNLLCSCLIYMPVKSFKGVKTLEEIYLKVKRSDASSKEDFMFPHVKKIIELIYDSKRYKDLRFRNFINRLDSNTQFGAITFTIRNIKVVSFRGTDKSIVGWQENFRLAYSYPTYTQELAISYLANNITLFDNEVYVTGHSKGGNLAMVSSMEQNPKKFKRIKQVINFDGPGFRKEEYKSLKYKILSEKLINIVPEGSYIGVLLFNDNYQVVTSSLKGTGVHYPTSWNCFGSIFIDGKLSKLSRELHSRTTKTVEGLSDESMKEAFETIFKQYVKKNTSKVVISFRELLSLVKTVRGMDNKTSQYIYQILSSMLNHKIEPNVKEKNKKVKNKDLEII